ncbi:GCN5-related N-acetyltransferase [Burkholderia sp. H160]|nr:GCN5-related N-acetyltransferase [Burkholderia sp. H160]
MVDADEAQFDAAIVLANQMDAQGQINDETRARMDCAVALYQARRVALVVTSGWAYRNDTAISLAEAMRRYAIEAHDLDGNVVVAQNSARDTVGDAVFTKLRLALPLRWSRVMVVTSTYHGARALEIFSFVYGPGFHVALSTAGSPDTAALREAEARSRAAFARTFEGVAPGDDAAIVARLSTRHPLYNGTVHAPLPDDVFRITNDVEGEAGMELTLRNATKEDARILFDWRNDPMTRLASHSTAELAFDAHTAWLDQVLSNPMRRLLIAEENGCPVGTVRVDREEDGCAVLSWTVTREARGRGIATRMVQLVADEISGSHAIRAEIKAGNEASVKVAEAAGMRFSRQAGNVLHFYRGR